MSGRINERLRAGAELASELVGLPGEVAFERAAQVGFDPQLVGPEVEALTADMKPDRIRLCLNEDGVVQEASRAERTSAMPPMGSVSRCSDSVNCVCFRCII
jgi:hypothetical protein